MAASKVRKESIASSIDACGLIVGMNRNEPSSSEGRNSRPSPGNFS